MSDQRHALINGLSVGSGGGYTVAVELFREIARARPGWRVTMALIQGHPLHEEMTRDGALPSNCGFLRAPAATLGRFGRMRYERSGLVEFVRREHVSCVLQLNGMVVPGMPAPTLAHFQDPWPYRPEAWTRPLPDSALAWGKRRANRRALTDAAACGWTSAYLRDLITSRHGIQPRRSEVFYNGVPDSWLENVEARAKPLGAREPEIVTISNVNAYKRQSLVIEALPDLLRTPGLEGIRYSIAGQIDPKYRQALEATAERLGVGSHVAILGRIPQEAVEDLFSRASAFVLMSVCESFGIPAVEAMCHGTPVVVADCCAIPEVCGDAAVLVPTDDRDALVAALTRVLTQPSEAERLRRAGFENVRRFSWNRIGARMAEVLDEIADGS